MITTTVEAALEVRHVSKEYPGVLALDKVDLILRPGEIHALAGQNGAGKSTLIKCISGVERPDVGAIFRSGAEQRFENPQDAQRCGIQTIYQELSLVPELSVAENISLGSWPRRYGLVSRASMEITARQRLSDLGVRLDVNAPVARLTLAEQQTVELAKALNRTAKVILLDEPTSALPPPDVKRLFALLRSVAAQGTALLFISHRTDEVFELCDHVTVLRDGRVVDNFEVETSSPIRMVSAMVGSGHESLLGGMEGTESRPSRTLGGASESEVLLSVRNIRDDSKVRGVSFDLHRGEALCFFGLVGSGQSESADIVAGARFRTSGTVSMAGERLRNGSPNDTIRHGIGLLPQDRKRSGFIPDMSVTRNITLASLQEFSKFSVMRRGRERRAAESMARRLDMKITGVQQSAKTLSGGTQQKLILARWLIKNLPILVFDEPTRGIDIAAKEEIYDLISEYVARGGSAVIATSEISEAMMCHRVLVYSRGKVVGDLRRDEIGPNGAELVAALGEGGATSFPGGRHDGVK